MSKVHEPPMKHNNHIATPKKQKGYMDKVN